MAHTKDLQKELENLGYASHHARVYVELLKNGKSFAGKIISATGLHRQLVYQAFEKLKASNLITEGQTRGKKIFIPLDPGKILNQAQEQAKRAATLVEDLRKLSVTRRDDIKIITLFGKEGLYKTLIDACEKAKQNDGVVRIVGGAYGSLFFDALGDLWPKYSSEVKKFRVTKHLIAPFESEEIYRESFLAEKGNKLRLLDKGLNTPSWTRITPGLVSLEMYDGDVTVIQIHSESYSRLYMNHFNMLWRVAHEWKPSEEKRIGKSKSRKN